MQSFINIADQADGSHGFKILFTIHDLRFTIHVVGAVARLSREGVISRDNLVKIVIDAPDSLSNRRWMKQYKDRWRSKLEQTELWMVSYAVEVE